MINRLIYAIIAILIPTQSAIGFDNFHFYRAGNFVGEPWFEKPGLTSVNISALYGATDQGRNGGCPGKKTCLLNIYGPAKMQPVGEGICKDTDNPVDIALTNLSLVPANDCFATLLFKGHFSIVEIDVLFTQNISCGWFVQAYMPARRLSITDVRFQDCTPTDENVEPNITNPEWQTFLNLFPDILAQYSLSLTSTTSKGMGDTSLLVGWTHNFQDTEVLDYVDASIKGGVLIPTGTTTNPDLVFSLPTGYNGHVGIPVQIDASMGSYDWLTLGGSLGAIIFLDKEHTVRMKTAVDQNGYIKLAKGKACVHQGSLWYISAYTKADHVCRGFSFLVGYSFARHNKDVLTPRDSATFNSHVVNSDEMFKAWQMHTINFLMEYDFTQESMRLGPHFSLFYNRQVGGKRTFNTSTGGGTFGVDIAWGF